MRSLTVILLLGVFALAGNTLCAASAPPLPAGRIVKVLPFFLDTNNVAYQFYLLDHTNDISGMRFDVLWKAHRARGLKLTIRVELRGVGPGGLPRQTVLEKSVTPKLFHHWASLTLNGSAWRDFGTLAAWRATLWNGNQLLGNQQSFLW